MALQFPLTDYEMNQIKGVEEHLKSSPDVLELDEKECSAYFDVLRAMEQRGIIKNVGIDNCNAYYVTGSFDEFKKWIESQNDRAKQNIISEESLQITFEPLSPNCEKLLTEILEHRDTQGNCDLSYWAKRFDSLSFKDDSILRSQFKTLKDRNMISVFWSESPYILVVLEEGLSYFEKKEKLQRRNLRNLTRTYNNKEYDVFISHARKDKLNYVDELFSSIKKLGVRIFYDTEEISWGDNWKQVILNGTAKSEFAIIVISKNFFGRDWTERELDEFLKRQNESGQKTVLPLLYKTTVEEMRERYPKLEDIQALETSEHTKDEIVIYFAKELIKRLKQK